MFFFVFVGTSTPAHIFTPSTYSLSGQSLCAMLCIYNTLSYYVKLKTGFVVSEKSICHQVLHLLDGLMLISCKLHCLFGAVQYSLSDVVVSVSRVYRQA